MAKSRKASRSFTIDNATHADSCGTKYKLRGNSGRFKSKDPRGAAKKAFSSLCRRKRIRGRCVLYISVRETTQGGSTKNKVFAYRFSRRKAETPGPFGQLYEVVGKSVKSVPDNCSKPRKTKGRMFSRTAKGKTGKYAYKSRSKSRSKSKSRSGKKSKSYSGKKSKSHSGKKSKSRSGKKSKSHSGKKSKSDSGKKSKSKSGKKKKSTLRKMFGL